MFSIICIFLIVNFSVFKLCNIKMFDSANIMPKTIWKTSLSELNVRDNEVTRDVVQADAVT